ncbi:AI-2E family transporter [Flavobacteriaceae bacterium KMM 6898]|nr:AI-2E family transporter [Flavobacteriaceae bacterium KMM 6898]
MKDFKTTNILLLVIVVPLVFYLLKILSFIFIPLVSSMFIALLFLPLMRGMNKRRVPKPISILVIVLIIAGIFKIGGELIQLTSNELLSSDQSFLEQAEDKLNIIIVGLEESLGMELLKGEDIYGQFLNKDSIIDNFVPTLSFIGSTLTMLLMTVFFAVLWLSESINVQKLLNSTIIKHKYSSVKAFMKIENDLIKFIKVKFLVSFFTGVGTGLACYLFDVDFPIFWGLFAFFINFVQMIGSFVTVILLSIFAFVGLDSTNVLLFFILTITGVQVLFGSILEPIFMGKSFSINIITILVMLMLWGYIWGIPGLILAIPITVFIKIILEQFPGTKIIAKIISGDGIKVDIGVNPIRKVS